MLQGIKVPLDWAL